MRARRDDGQLLLLAGIVLVLGFVVTAFTLSQVAEVEKQAAKEQESSFLTEYRFAQGKLGQILSGNTGRTTDNASFHAIFNVTVTSFRNTLAAKGFDSYIVLAGNGTGLGRVECSYLAQPCRPTAVPPPGANNWTNVPVMGRGSALNHTYDGRSDGIVWMCDQRGSIVGAVVYLYLSDGRTALSETIVYPLNQDWYGWPAPGPRGEIHKRQWQGPSPAPSGWRCI